MNYSQNPNSTTIKDGIELGLNQAETVRQELSNKAQNLYSFRKLQSKEKPSQTIQFIRIQSKLKFSSNNFI